MRSYPAKLLLFGEHVVLLGAPALAVPATAFSGRWAWREPDVPLTDHDRRLREFARSEALAAVPGLDAAAFHEDLEKGLFFESDIPAGCGLGSSGALCAAVYDRYCTGKNEDLVALKARFAAMEGFFHGNSSGIDPLTSYLDRPVIVQHKTEVRAGDWPDWDTPPPQLFLVDSGSPRQSGPMIRWFQEKSRETPFARFLQERYLPLHEAALHSWEAGRSGDFYDHLAAIATEQYTWMPALFPAALTGWWRQTFDSGVRLKICGAGGGGFVLGIARTPAAVAEIARSRAVVYPLEPKAIPHEKTA